MRFNAKEQKCSYFLKHPQLLQFFLQNILHYGILQLLNRKSKMVLINRIYLRNKALS